MYLLQHLTNMREKFVSHSEVKQHQSRIFKVNIEKAKSYDSCAVLQIDWAENYKCFAQNKTQKKIGTFVSNDKIVFNQYRT